MDNPLTRVERDARGPRATYEDFEIGASLGELTWSIRPEQVRGLIENDQDYHPWYVDDSPFGAPIAPPLVTYPPVRILFTRRYNVRGLFYIFESEFFEPIFYNRELRITGEITDKWIKRDREFVMYRCEATRVDDGVRIFATKRAHVLDYITRDAPREGEGVDSGLVS